MSDTIHTTGPHNNWTATMVDDAVDATVQRRAGRSRAYTMIQHPRIDILQAGDVPTAVSQCLDAAQEDCDRRNAVADYRIVVRDVDAVELAVSESVRLRPVPLPDETMAQLSAGVGAESAQVIHSVGALIQATLPGITARDEAIVKLTDSIGRMMAAQSDGMAHLYALLSQATADQQKAVQASALVQLERLKVEHEAAEDMRDRESRDARIDGIGKGIWQVIELAGEPLEQWLATKLGVSLPPREIDAGDVADPLADLKVEVGG